MSHGTSPLGRRLRTHAAAIRRTVATYGGANVRVFGSVATGRDHDESDIDLMFTMRTPLSLMQLGALEQQIQTILGVPVGLVPDSALAQHLRERALQEAIPL